MLEVGRRMLFDFKKYGDSPLCIKEVKNQVGKVSLVQGFGLTADCEESREFLQTHVTILSNEKCGKILQHNISSHLINYHKLTSPTTGSLKYGITDQIICTLGIEDEDTKHISVSKFHHISYMQDLEL